MSKQFVFTRKRSPQKKINDFIGEYGLVKTYNDRFEKIYESKDMILSVTRRVTWISISDNCSRKLNDVKSFFDGEQCKHGQNEGEVNYENVKQGHVRKPTRRTEIRIHKNRRSG